VTPESFQEIIWQKARELYREMPWRTDTRPYYVLVSEIMLQQTQVARVRVKFAEFIERFPTIADLAKAPLADVLTIWSGLGYNRRAKFLHSAAKEVVDRFEGEVPANLTDLVSLSGVGPNTAGAILTYSFNQPVVFIETNIRTVLFAHFFENQDTVSDKELKELLEKLIDKEHPREFYWALMDYGTQLKAAGLGALDKSKHYKKQAPLKGSVREVRGMILKQLAKEATSTDELQALLPAGDERLPLATAGLLNDGLIELRDGRFHLTR
jgi:A/G-specific adenine glycosylase